MKILLLTLTFTLLLCLTLRAEDQALAEKLFKNLLTAQAARDFDAFIADGTDQLKAALTETQFVAASNAINARLKGGYESTYLGEVNLQGHEVYLFRLRFKDGGDDMLGTMSLKDGKVAGIYFK